MDLVGYRSPFFSSLAFQVSHNPSVKILQVTLQFMAHVFLSLQNRSILLSTEAPVAKDPPWSIENFVDFFHRQACDLWNQEVDVDKSYEAPSGEENKCAPIIRSL